MGSTPVRRSTEPTPFVTDYARRLTFLTLAHVWKLMATSSRAAFTWEKSLLFAFFAEHSARNARNAGAVWALGIGWGELKTESITWHVSPVMPVPVNFPRVSNSRFWTPDCCARPIIWMWLRVTILRHRRIAIPSTVAKAARRNASGQPLPRSSLQSCRLTFRWTATPMDRTLRG